MIHRSNLKQTSVCPIVTAVTIMLTGCAATQTAIEHRNLETTTKLSETVFLNPITDAQKTVYVSVKNTSDQDIEIESALKSSFAAHGY